MSIMCIGITLLFTGDGESPGKEKTLCRVIFSLHSYFLLTFIARTLKLPNKWVPTYTTY
jgi:hypothetical protein